MYICMYGYICLSVCLFVYVRREPMAGWVNVSYSNAQTYLYRSSVYICMYVCVFVCLLVCLCNEATLGLCNR